MTAILGVRCSAILTVKDPRLGEVEAQCQFAEGHVNEHGIAYAGTEPPSYLRWMSPCPTT